MTEKENSIRNPAHLSGSSASKSMEVHMVDSITIIAAMTPLPPSSSGTCATGQRAGISQLSIPAKNTGPRRGESSRPWLAWIRCTWAATWRGHFSRKKSRFTLFQSIQHFSKNPKICFPQISAEKCAPHPKSSCIFYRSALVLMKFLQTHRIFFHICNRAAAFMHIWSIK